MPAIWGIEYENDRSFLVDTMRNCNRLRCLLLRIYIAAVVVALNKGPIHMHAGEEVTVIIRNELLIESWRFKHTVTHDMSAKELALRMAEPLTLGTIIHIVREDKTYPDGYKYQVGQYAGLTSVTRL
jgi:hypothetical protein